MSQFGQGECQSLDWPSHSEFEEDTRMELAVLWKTSLVASSQNSDRISVLVGALLPIGHP